MFVLEWKKLHESAKAPIRSLPESAAFDVHAFLLSESNRPTKRMLSTRSTVMIPTKIAVRPPKGHFIMVCSRSGYATKSIFVANAPGVVDPDYTGEIIVLLFNGGHESFYVEHEHRIAQLLVLPLPLVTTREAKDFPETVRGDRGFGSTGN